MARLAPLPARRVVRALEKLGFHLVRQRGSHASYVHPDGRIVTVPMHSGREIARGTLREIIRVAGVSVDEFL
ncbi:MAG TPA: type II toxin-antitoxin system HicA family toxin [Thermoplasmata archaeon]|nr:type II toxin-antitoxin system HicA family toxin [Thermoplasmata archaeon]